MELDFRKDYVEFRAPRKPPREVSVIPLINIIFLLLIFFLVGGTVQKADAIPVDYPEADSGKLLDEGHISIILGADGKAVVNDEDIAREALQEKLESLLQNNKERVITLKADAKLPARDMIDAMNAIKQAGGINISLVTQQRIAHP